MQKPFSFVNKNHLVGELKSFHFGKKTILFPYHCNSFGGKMLVFEEKPGGRCNAFDRKLCPFPPGNGGRPHFAA